MHLLGTRLLYAAAALWAVAWIAVFMGGVPTPLDYVLTLIGSPYSGESLEDRLVEYATFLPAVILFIAAQRLSDKRP